MLYLHLQGGKASRWLHRVRKTIASPKFLATAGPLDLLLSMFGILFAGSFSIKSIVAPSKRSPARPSQGALCRYTYHQPWGLAVCLASPASLPKEQEALVSSNLCRSNSCPGSKASPQEMSLGFLPSLPACPHMVPFPQPHGLCRRRNLEGLRAAVSESPRPLWLRGAGPVSGSLEAPRPDHPPLLPAPVHGA